MNSNGERLRNLKHKLEVELPEVHIYTDFEETYLHVVYEGKSVCKINIDGYGYNINFISEFRVNRHSSIGWRPGYKGISCSIRNAIRIYEKGQNNMMTLSDLRDYIKQEIGNLVAVVYEPGKTGLGPNGDRIKINHGGWCVCSVYRNKQSNGNLFTIIFYDPFICRERGYSSVVDLTVAEVPRAIKNRIRIYDNEKEVKNMVNKHFVVEKMDIEQKCGEPDTINMVIRKEPDGIPFQMGRELKTIIESLDPDKLSSSDYRINVNVSDHALDATIYAMSARGNGNTRYIPSPIVPDELKSGTFIFNSIKDVIFNNPATIIFWVDGSKTVVKCQSGEAFDPEKGLAMAISKKVLGNDYGYYETFAKYVGRYNKKHKEK